MTKDERPQEPKSLTITYDIDDPADARIYVTCFWAMEQSTRK